MKDKLTQQLLRDEGEKLQAYQDHLGYWTIGVGRLIDGRKGGGISKEESLMLLTNDVNKVYEQVKESIPFFKDLNEARQGALCNMAFQMGLEGLLKFKMTMYSLSRGDFEEAARRMKNSLWARQTPERANRIAEQIKTGEWK